MRLIVVLALFLTSCGRADYTWPALIKLHPNTAPILSISAIRSIEQLNTFIGEDVTKFTVSADTITSYDIIVKFADQADGKKAGLAVVYDHVCHITVFPVAVQMNLIQTVLWHEIAHCAGVMHVAESGQIMSESINQFDYYSQDKLNFFKKQLTNMLKGKMR